MAKHCDQCQQLDALNTDLTNLLKALIKGEADDKHPLMKVWLQKRDIAWFNHFCESLQEYVLPDTPLSISTLKKAFFAIHLHPEKLEIMEINHDN